MCGRPRRPPRARERGAPPLAGSTRVRGALHFSLLELKCQNLSIILLHVVLALRLTQKKVQPRGARRAWAGTHNSQERSFATASPSPSRRCAVLPRSCCRDQSPSSESSLPISSASSREIAATSRSPHPRSRPRGARDARSITRSRHPSTSSARSPN